MALIPMIELYLSTLELQLRTEENQECNSIYYSTYRKMASLVVNKVNPRDTTVTIS